MILKKNLAQQLAVLKRRPDHGLIILEKCRPASPHMNVAGIAGSDHI
jgi:hypothetical protein